MREHLISNSTNFTIIKSKSDSGILFLSPKKLLLEVCREKCPPDRTRLVRPGHFSGPRIKPRVTNPTTHASGLRMGIGREMVILRSLCPRTRTCTRNRDRKWGIIALSGRSAMLRRHTIVIDRGISIWTTCMCGRRYLRKPSSRRAKLPCSYVLKGRKGIKLPDVRVGVFFILRTSHAGQWGHVTKG